MIISTDSAGRNHSDLEGQVGYFLQLLPVRVQVGAEESFSSLLNRTGAGLLEAYAHQSYPVESLLEEIPSLHQSSLYDMLVLFQNFDNAVGFDHLLEGAEMETEETDNGTSFNDLVVELLPNRHPALHRQLKLPVQLLPRLHQRVEPLLCR